MMKNIFNFILKAFFVIKIIKFLYLLIVHVEKKVDLKDKVTFIAYDVTTWLTINYNTHIVKYLTK